METKIKQYQIIQETYDRFIIKLAIDKQYSEKDTKSIRELMNHLFGEDIDIEFDFVDSIPLTKSGKFRVIVSKVPIEFNRSTA